ncbi:YjjG family noncanonical pyrimidine nucleotidase [Roseivirga sp. BDSF3-8]|uniref:YjjG family noncanonical pyrimidine nucleotidase n=1 Tax=Roseivirga sp. BDSF3-8 TaxID=3241598 RepID=UPI0035325D58
MRKTYKHIFFDLDHTLWDYEKNSHETLTELYYHYRLYEFNRFTADELIERFSLINRKLWRQFNDGKVTASYLRKKRFLDVFDSLGLARAVVPESFTDDYVRLCPTKTNLIPYTLEMLDYLKEKQYKLHIITNGFRDVQHIKLSKSNLSDYFTEIVTSDCTGFKKPHKQIFAFLLDKAKAEQGECIMVGDNLEADILGARNMKIDQVYYNRHNLKHKESPNFEITCLSELQKIL